MVFVLLGGAVTLVAVVVGWSAVFRRRAPKWTTKDLLQALRKHKASEKLLENLQRQNLSLQVVPSLSLHERHLLKTAFVKGVDFRWMALGAIKATKPDQKDGTTMDSEEDKNLVQQVTFYMVECVLRFTELYGHVIVCRDNDASKEGDGGQYLGSIGLVPPYTSSTLFQAHFLRSVIPLGQPVPKKLERPPVAARFEAFTSSMERVHKESTKEPHWYVANLGVAESAQGQGVGRLLVETAKLLAQDDGPLYLECHDDNVAFYEKRGFHLLQRTVLKPNRSGATTTCAEPSTANTADTTNGSNAAPSNSPADTLRYNAMIYHLPLQK